VKNAIFLVTVERLQEATAVRIEKSIFKLEIETKSRKQLLKINII
jgi:hypothetical protein